MTTRSQTVAADIAALLRARNPLLWVVTREEARVERYLAEAAVAAKYVARTWDVAAGLCDLEGNPLNIVEGSEDPGTALDVIRDQAATGTQKGLWILRDLPPWLGAGPAGAGVMRRLRNLARSLPGAEPNRGQAMIILSPSGEIPPELAGHAVVIDWPMPDRAEVAAILDVAIETNCGPGKAEVPSAETRDAAIDAAVGLTGEEAASTFSKSLVQLRKICPKAIAGEKKRVIAREKILEWFDPLPMGLAAVGGLENLKSWLLTRTAAYTPAARAYGLPTPKGVLLVGISGCGKSLTAKAISTAWNCPLLRVDLGAIKSKFVGESEQNLRKAFDVIASIGRCVVWFDEVEKALQGATSGSADGGVSADALGAILTWMQERQGEAFVVMTANDVSSLPPELLRKGRFDELFFVDLPTERERLEVMVAALRSHGRGELALDLDIVVDATPGFTGSEIAALVPDALFAAFNDGAREITGQDLADAAASVVPLSKTAAVKIAGMREWGRANARPASKVQQTVASKASRQLDL